jgi:hypothetical protein
VIILHYKKDVDRHYEEDVELASKKLETIVKKLEFANPMIREALEIEYGLYFTYDSGSIRYPYIFIVPKGIIDEISNYLLTLYQQNYSSFTKLPPEFVPNENIQSPELQEFLIKLPFDLITEAVVGTYRSSPAVILPKGDYSQYLTFNEHLINLGDSIVIVFGNPQLQHVPTTQTPEQQNDPSPKSLQYHQ